MSESRKPFEALGDPASPERAPGDPQTLRVEKSMVLNTVNFVRAMNGLARWLGVDQAISIVSEEAKGKVDYLTLLRSALSDARQPQS